MVIDNPSGTSYNGVVIDDGSSLNVNTAKLRILNAGQPWGGIPAHPGIGWKLTDHKLKPDHFRQRRHSDFVSLIYPNLRENRVISIVMDERGRRVWAAAEAKISAL